MATPLTTTPSLDLRTLVLACACDHLALLPTTTDEILARCSLPKLALKPWIPAAPAGLILTNAQVVDPAAGKLLDGLQSVVVKNGKIAAVYPVDEPDLLEEEAGLRKVDLDGRYICPGLIDAHVHVTAVPGVKTISELVRTPEEDIHYRTIYILREMLLRGFTTVRDTGAFLRAFSLRPALKIYYRRRRSIEAPRERD